MSDFVPDEFEAPLVLIGDDFVLEPLGTQHNERDHMAWMSSIEHIRATRGFEDGSWPHEMALDDNLRDLEMHARDFASRSGFTYTVLDPKTRDVIGCVYIYPAENSPHDAQVRSWVRASRADLDVPLWRAVSDWLASDVWPFSSVSYAARH